MTCELILGGARSGKSREAERRAAASGLAVTVIATMLLGSLMASRERSGKGELAAEAVLAQVKGAIDGKLLQVGGDATTGRGLVAARVITGTAN